MSETVNQGNNTNEGNEGTSKTFTQAEVNAIVGDRLARAAEKYSDYDALKEKAAKFDEIEEQNKSELEKAQEKIASLQAMVDSNNKATKLRELHEKVAKEKGVPVELIVGEDEESCNSYADELLKFKGSNSYSRIKDNGEVKHSTSGETTASQFADWFNRAF